jgi:hypothetical protein
MDENGNSESGNNKAYGQPLHDASRDPEGGV